MRFIHWLSFSSLLLVAGIVLHFSGVPLNTNIYSISYTCLSAGAGGYLLSMFYYIVDVQRSGQLLWMPFMFMGMNAISMYIFAEGDIVDWFLGCFYVGSDPDKNLSNILWPTGVYWGDSSDRPTAPSHNIAMFFWTLGYIAVTAVLAWYMYKNKIFVTI